MRSGSRQFLGQVRHRYAFYVAREFGSRLARIQALLEFCQVGSHPLDDRELGQAASFDCCAIAGNCFADTCDQGTCRRLYRPCLQIDTRAIGRRVRYHLRDTKRFGLAIAKVDQQWIVLIQIRGHTL